jgi:ribulose-5-phosphate 4-epimerase/fuculose-1-phosphate aldolase
MDPILKTALDELMMANQILVQEGVIDGFGHVSIRHPSQSDHYFMIRNNAATTIEDAVMELDRESNPVRTEKQRPSIERFIHGEIYRARSEVMAVVHTHAPALIPFGVSSMKLKPLYHMCGFLGTGVPVFDIGKEHGPTNMLITSHELGQSLVRSLEKNSLVLMRGHGATIVGTSVKEAVYKAVYTNLNAQLQPVAMQMGEPTYLSTEEARLADELHHAVLDRPWNFWVAKVKNHSA